MPASFFDRQRAFTLIEVLVALAVVVVAFLAMYGSAQQIVRSTTVQQDKTFASWVAFDQLTELRLAENLPQGERLTGETEMAGREWRYVVEFNDVDSNFIRQAIVRVSPIEEPELILAESLGVLLISPGRSTSSGALLQTSNGSGGLSGLQDAGSSGDAGSNPGINPGIAPEDVAGNDPGTRISR